MRASHFKNIDLPQLAAELAPRFRRTSLSNALVAMRGAGTSLTDACLSMTEGRIRASYVSISNRSVLILDRRMR